MAARAARIVDTLHCSELWVTNAVLADLDAPGRSAEFDVVRRDLVLHDAHGALRPF